MIPLAWQGSPGVAPQGPPGINLDMFRPSFWWRLFYHSPIGFFSILFLAPVIYNLVSDEPIRSLNDAQLQEVAMWMDNIYTILANMTFIPDTAIKRGPHKINTTAIECSLHPNVLRLMELLPYVDKNEVLKAGEAYSIDWLYGGEFLDYSDPDDLYYACTPLHGYDGWAPEIVALTSWGQGGWNGDRTHVLMYDTTTDAISVFEGEEWIYMRDTDEPQSSDYEDFTGIGLYDHSIQRPLAALAKGEWETEQWFDAPTFLNRIWHAYRSLAWTPWQTSNKEDGWGVDIHVIRDLLSSNGWDDSFDPDKFKADFIRAKKSAGNNVDAEDAVAQTDGIEYLTASLDNAANAAFLTDDIEK